MKGVLGDLISENQNAFACERLIQDNILVTQEMFHSFRNRRWDTKWMAIKVDLNKAYDRVEWGFNLLRKC